jgi:hypothetical protein
MKDSFIAITNHCTHPDNCSCILPASLITPLGVFVPLWLDGHEDTKYTNEKESDVRLKKGLQ